MISILDAWKVCSIWKMSYLYSKGLRSYVIFHEILVHFQTVFLFSNLWRWLVGNHQSIRGLKPIHIKLPQNYTLPKNVAKFYFKNTFSRFFGGIFFLKNYDTVCLLHFEVKISENLPLKKQKSLIKHHWLSLRASQIVFKVRNNLDNSNPHYYHHALQIMASGQT